MVLVNFVEVDMVEHPRRRDGWDHRRYCVLSERNKNPECSKGKELLLTTCTCVMSEWFTSPAPRECRFCPHLSLFCL